jgi:2-phosphoglycerate kinase
MDANRRWDVLLLGGASGVGKTRLARELADAYQVDVFHVDDLQAALEAVTTPEQQPELHWWRTHPEEFAQLSDRQLVEHFVAVSRGVFEPALVAIIAQHLDEDWPVIIEGDFVTPALATMDRFDDQPNSGRVRAVFLYEDESQIEKNYGGREGDGQVFRAHASWLNGQWLQQECASLQIPGLAARPWATAADRAVALLDEPSR